MEKEREAAEKTRRGFIAKRRYRPEQWDDVRDWRTYAGSGGDKWFGFDAVRQLDGLPPEILMVPLPGHTWGHAGVAVHSEHGWVLNAGDAYFYRREMDRKHRCTPGLRFYQKLMEVDRKARLTNQERLRSLANDDLARVRVFCSHDAIELERMQQLGNPREPIVPARDRPLQPATA
jgi:glyoxylase-like metal-dependent hydrolase (beta-lactamase superfamily II)